MKRALFVALLAVAFLSLTATSAFGVTNLVTNGDFQAGNTGFTSGYTYVAVASTTGGAYGLGSLDLEGQYATGLDPAYYHSLWANFFDHTLADGTGLMMIVNGNENASPPPTMYETVVNSLTPGDTYTLSFWGATSYPAANANLTVEINGVNVGTYDAPATVANWTEFSVDWVADAASADIELVDTNMTHTGNDFAIDDVSLVLKNHVVVNGTVTATKFYDLNQNGVQDGGELGIQGWPINLFDTSGVLVATQFSDLDGNVEFANVVPGDYTLSEGWTPAPTTWHQTTPAGNSFAVTVAEGSSQSFLFGNVCERRSTGGLTLGFWSNKNGKAILDAHSPAWMTLLSGLHLVKADGSAFDPSGYAGFRPWILGATATNMSYMLSAQMAATQLDVAYGNLKGANLVLSPSGSWVTINALILEADAFLAAHPNTTASGADRILAEKYKNIFDALNNNTAIIVPADHCPVPSFKWLLSVNGGAYLHDMLLVNVSPTGVMSAVGGHPAGGGPVYPYPYNWVLTGQVTGSSVTFTITYQNGYTATVSGTVNSDWNFMSGGAGTGGVTDWSATLQ